MNRYTILFKSIFLWWKRVIIIFFVDMQFSLFRLLYLDFVFFPSSCKVFLEGVHQVRGLNESVSNVSMVMCKISQLHLYLICELYNIVNIKNDWFLEMREPFLIELYGSP